MKSIARASRVLHHTSPNKPQSGNSLKLGVAKLVNWLTNGSSSWAEKVILSTAKELAEQTRKYNPGLLKRTYSQLKINDAKNITSIQLASRLIEELTENEKPALLVRALAHISENIKPRAKKNKDNLLIGIDFNIPIYEHSVSQPRKIPRVVWEGFVELKEEVQKFSTKEEEKDIDTVFEQLLETISDRIEHPDHLKNKRLIEHLDKKTLAVQIMKASIPKIKETGHDKLAKILSKACDHKINN